MSETKSIVERLEMEADVSDFRISKGIKLYSGPILRAIAAELREIARGERQSAMAGWAKGEDAAARLGADDVLTRSIEFQAASCEERADRISRREEP
jgi:hypothetical protein